MSYKDYIIIILLSSTVSLLFNKNPIQEAEENPIQEAEAESKPTSWIDSANGWSCVNIIDSLHVKGAVLGVSWLQTNPSNLHRSQYLARNFGSSLAVIPRKSDAINDKQGPKILDSHIVTAPDGGSYYCWLS